MAKVVSLDAMPQASFWRGKRVFVSGHTGFKGAWLSLWLQSLGAEITGYALAPPTKPSLFVLAQVEAGMQSVLGDVRDAAALAAALAASAPDIVIHMAAQPLVRASYRDPVGTYATNLMGTVHLLDAVRQAPSARAVVVVTTDKCYENREWLWSYRESDALGGFDPYSNSKACAELATGAFRSAFFHPERHAQHGVAVATARAGNVIGGGDWSDDRLVPDFLRAAFGGAPLELRYPAAVRPWQHVLEPLAGYLRLAQLLFERGPEVSGAWNFGPGEEGERSVGEVVGQLASCWPVPVDVRLAAASPALHEAGLLKLDSSRARTHLGWQPRWTLQRTLSSIAEWHASHLAGASMRSVTEAQIAAYAQEASVAAIGAASVH